TAPAGTPAVSWGGGRLPPRPRSLPVPVPKRAAPPSPPCVRLASARSCRSKPAKLSPGSSVTPQIPSRPAAAAAARTELVPTVRRLGRPVIAEPSPLGMESVGPSVGPSVGTPSWWCGISLPSVMTSPSATRRRTAEPPRHARRWNPWLLCWWQQCVDRPGSRVYVDFFLETVPHRPPGEPAAPDSPIPGIQGPGGASPFSPVSPGAESRLGIAILRPERPRTRKQPRPRACSDLGTLPPEFQLLPAKGSKTMITQAVRPRGDPPVSDLM